MIFVTVGTTLPFDPLIEAMDRFSASGQIDEPVVCQIGNGRYVPKHCESFRFGFDIPEWITRASVVVGHGGTGTVTSLLAERKPFVAVANDLAADNHQAEFLARLNRLAPFLWTKNLEELPRLISLAPTFKIQPAEAGQLAVDLRKYLLRLVG